MIHMLVYEKTLGSLRGFSMFLCYSVISNRFFMVFSTALRMFS